MIPITTYGNYFLYHHITKLEQKKVNRGKLCEKMNKKRISGQSVCNLSAATSEYGSDGSKFGQIKDSSIHGFPRQRERKAGLLAEQKRTETSGILLSLNEYCI